MKTKLQALFWAGIVSVVPSAASAPTPVTLQNATADFSQIGFPVSASTDGVIVSSTGWAIAPLMGLNHTAVYESQTDFGYVGGTSLGFTLYTGYDTPLFGHFIGRFRLSVTTDDRGVFADGLDSGGDVTANWIVLDPTEWFTSLGSTFVELPDHSLLASGATPNNHYYDTYTVRAWTSLTGITGVRLEVLADPSLPSGGPGRYSNGNFVLNEIRLEYVPTPTPDAGAGWAGLWVLMGLCGLRRRWPRS